MSSILGADAPWFHGWIRPFVHDTPSFAGTIIFYQINNYTEQMNNQIQVVNIDNSAANANISVALSEHAANSQHF